MAITLDSSSSSPAPLGKHLEFVVSSDDPDIVRMKGNLSIEMDAVIILDPDIGETDVFTFDFQKIVERNLGGYLTINEGGHGFPDLTSYIILDADEAWVNVQGTFIELVSSSTSSGLFEGETEVPLTTINVVNAFLPREQSQTFTAFDLTATTPVDMNESRFLTNNSPLSPFPITRRKIKLTDNEWLSAFTSTAFTDLRLRIAVTDTSGVVTISFIDASDLVTYTRADIPVGPVNINNATLSAESAGIQPIINDATKSYTVKLVNLGSEEVPNGDFSSSAGWTLNSWTISGGEAHATIVTPGDFLSRTLSLSTSTDYLISTEKTGGTGPNDVRISHDNNQYISVEGSDGNIVFNAEFTTASTIIQPDIELDWVSMGGSVDLDFVTIREIEVISETITFVMDKACNEKEVRFHWENRLGGLDSYTFQAEKRSIAVDKKTYTKPLTSDFTASSRGRTTLGGESSIPFQAFTTNLRDNEQIWLEEILEDRATYIQVDGNIIPVTVTRSSAPTIDEGLVQLRIDYQYANNRIILGK